MAVKSLLLGLIGGLAVAAPAYLAGCATGSVSTGSAVGIPALSDPYTITLSACTAATAAINYGVQHGYATDATRRPLIDAIVTAAKPVCLGPAPTGSQALTVADTAEIAALNAAVSALDAYAVAHP